MPCTGYVKFSSSHYFDRYSKGHSHWRNRAIARMSVARDKRYAQLCTFLPEVLMRKLDLSMY